ncbi:Scr1 family TA system antitoxin-like transcriptional regulator [Streptomyces decoyicus]|uniref:Scr1 family TA system antitoxin-like transcriptional regulator n=1 Tax=Streptomyces decoyicus TaxID=249567 RepID=UPI00365EC26B
MAADLHRFGLSKADIGGALDLLDHPECQPVHDGGDGWAARLAACENSASHIRIYALQILPQVLQTRAFTKALQSAGVLPQGYHPERTLAAASAVAVDLTADWALLERANGGPQVMAEQLTQLLQRIDAGQLRMRIIPANSAAIIPGTPQLSEMWVANHRLFAAETTTCVLYVTGPLDGGAYAMRFDEVTASALTEQETRDVLTDYRQRYQQQAAGVRP